MEEEKVSQSEEGGVSTHEWEGESEPIRCRVRVHSWWGGESE